MPQRLKILHVASWFPSEVHGSLGNFIERHVEAVATVHDCEVWAPVAVKGSRASMMKMREKNGEEIREVDGRMWKVKRLYHEATKPQLLGVARAVATEAVKVDEVPDVVHLHVAYPAGSAAVAWAKRWKVPVVLTEHWTAYHEPQGWPWWRRKAIKDVVKGVDVVCPVTDDLGQSMANWVDGVCIRVVPNVVDTEAFKPGEPETLAGVVVGASRRKLEGQGPTKMLHVSSMNDDQKNITGLLEGVAAAKDAVPGLRVTFVGGEKVDLGPYRDKAKALGLEGVVEFLGPLPSLEVAEVMRSHDALLLNSRQENFPCVIPEAWASGLPVVSTDVGGIREHLPPGLSELGLLLGREASAADWVESLKTLHATRWNAHRIRECAEATFSVAAVAQAYTEVYQNSMNR